jgi:hypothetical protein
MRSRQKGRSTETPAGRYVRTVVGNLDGLRPPTIGRHDALWRVFRASADGLRTKGALYLVTCPIALDPPRLHFGDRAQAVYRGPYKILKPRSSPIDI